MIIKDDFLSKILEKNCGIANLDKLKTIHELQKYQFVSAKTPDNTNLSIKASNFGFYLAEITVNLRAEVAKLESSLPKTSNCIIATDEHISIIKGIAYDSFVFDRFHSDPKISDEKASEIKRQWVGNYFKGLRGDRCFVYVKENIAMGFLLALKKEGKAIIDLFAVGEKYRGLGVGQDLLHHTINHYQSSVDAIEVGTQLINLPSINRYKSVGFKIISNNLVWHFHNTNKF